MGPRSRNRVQQPLRSRLAALQPWCATHVMTRISCSSWLRCLCLWTVNPMPCPATPPDIERRNRVTGFVWLLDHIVIAFDSPRGSSFLLQLWVALVQKIPTASLCTGIPALVTVNCPSVPDDWAEKLNCGRWYFPEASASIFGWVDRQSFLVLEPRRAIWTAECHLEARTAFGYRQWL